MFVNKMEKEAVASLRPVGGWSEATQAGPRGAHETSECKKLAESGWIILTAHSFLASLAEIQLGWSLVLGVRPSSNFNWNSV